MIFIYTFGLVWFGFVLVSFRFGFISFWFRFIWFRFVLVSFRFGFVSQSTVSRDFDGIVYCVR